MSRFQALSVYEQGLSGGYNVLPFRFSELDENRYVMTNMVGEFAVTDRESIQQFASGHLASSSSLYSELKSKHFLQDSDSGVSIDLLALKLRTKLAPLANFTALHLFVTTLRCDHAD